MYEYSECLTVKQYLISRVVELQEYRDRKALNQAATYSGIEEVCLEVGVGNLLHLGNGQTLFRYICVRIALSTY